MSAIGVCCGARKNNAPSGLQKENAMFPTPVADHWREAFAKGDLLYADETFRLSVSDDLKDEEQLGQILETAAGTVHALIRPALARRLNVSGKESLSLELFRQRTQEAGARFHGADHLFYFPANATTETRAPLSPETARRLTAADEGMFTAFCADITEADMDAAYVELDHWSVFGAFHQGELAGVASMYPWGESRLLDMGVLTAPPFRGQGHAGRLIRLMHQVAREGGFALQYRCQLDNHPSVAAAASTGMKAFGRWDIIFDNAADA
ncbi:GNAT family N-acetyltransferase [Brevundimonas pondensis]|uniref:GNAT family N-acetyltransferase n=1 Tax=Brevundimonas pondensis TaxID=2774189 RepID=A0ABX7SM08_9CAUL|nr:GNAT family N-acetyltransferase [Brevundimonas pondensis]QTC87845.1 GNAT family N-acetyltransferase [Brevundimonas pondensis]